jgi:glycosyltransferase involved in cell wall biosynthesis
LPDLTFCVCKEDQTYLERTFGKPCIYLPNGIPAVTLREAKEIGRWGLTGNDYLLFMARLVPEKGAHVLLNAWLQIPIEQRRNMKLVIAGDSNHRDKYYHQLMDFDIHKDIIFTGFVVGNLKAELLTNALCFIQPSSIEGMSLSILEAMGYGRLILASDIQENKDILGDNGRYFKTGNIADLSTKIVDILQLEQEAIVALGRRMNAYGKEKYDWDNIVDNMEDNLLGLWKDSR